VLAVLKSTTKLFADETTARVLDPGTNLLTKPFIVEELAVKIRKISMVAAKIRGICSYDAFGMTWSLAREPHSSHGGHGPEFQGPVYSFGRRRANATEAPPAP
jgi:hypothetical protein